MEPRQLSDCRVLMASNSPDVQKLVKLVLNRHGAEVIAVDNGRAAVDSALAALNERPFDAVLVDIQMPELDGLEATRKLRSEGYVGVIVAMTPMLGEMADRRACLAAGCDEYISLPLAPTRIVDVLSRIIRMAATIRD